MKAEQSSDIEAFEKKLQEMKAAHKESLKRLIADQEQRGVVIAVPGGYILNLGDEVTFEEAFGPRPKSAENARDATCDYTKYAP